MAKHTTRKLLLMAFAALMLAVSLPTVQAASKPRLNKTRVAVYVGRTMTVKVQGASGAVKWKSGNRKIATVKKTGGKSAKVTARRAGKTVITAKIGKKSVTCSVTVKNPYLNVKDKTLRVNQGFQLKLTGAKIRSCQSSDAAVAAVEKSGKVTAKKAGKAVISVKASNGRSYKCSVTVEDAECQRKDISKIGVEIHLYEEFYDYTGTAVEPYVSVYGGSMYLTRNLDYTVSYSNNVNAGKAQVIVKGIGKYKGKLTKAFEISKIDQYVTASLEDETVYVGKTGKVNVSGAYGHLEFTMSKEGIAEIDSNGIITGLKTGVTYVYLAAGGDENHYDSGSSDYVGKLIVMHEEPSVYGFEVDGWSSGDTYKKLRVDSRNDDGTNTYKAYFECNAGEEWLDHNVTFEARDVTPAAYAEMFADMGVAYEGPSVTVESAAERVEENQRYGFKINEPYTEAGPGGYNETPASGKRIIINAGAGVRVVKLIAKKGDAVLDYIYLGSSINKLGQKSSAYDVELYRKVRRKVEAQIWTDGMSNLEKLWALADYINETTHYPMTAATSKEFNPTFWENWAVDDKDLLYNMFNDVVLNRIMDLQGGIVTCQARSILSTAATEDLGLPYLYDRESDTVAPGEGVWSTRGSYSSDPSNPYHESLAYKSADEEEVLIDAQGMGYGDPPEKASCEKHGCKDKIVPLK